MMSAAPPVDAAKIIEAAQKAVLQKQREKAEAERENSLQEEVDAEVFSAYECRSLPATLGKPHPGDISEPGLLAAVSLPAPTYGSEAFDGEAIDDTKLSRLQLEGVLYAAQRHTHILPEGKRAGFFIGDGAGVGKGRQIAGILLDSWVRGRRKHIWFSISNDLKLDAERDLKDVGCHISVIDGCQGLDAASSKGLGMSKSAKHGCLFSTYSTLASGRSGGAAKKSRLDQLVDWCGGADFEGCLVFDEAHKAKNFNSAKEENSTKVAQAVIKIQDMLPKARVLYCSATGVTDIGNLAYATRLGLWGPQSPFPSFKEFKESMEKRGLGALEMLAMELKAKGSYVSRGLGWKGALFETLEVRLPPSTIVMYDRAVEFWMELRRELEKAAKMCGNSGMCKADRCQNGHVCSPIRQFWGQQQRFFKEMANSSKVEFVVAQAKEALADGMSVVIGLQSTGESGMDKAMSEMNKRPGDSVDRLVSAARYGTTSFIYQFFPVRTVPKTVHIMTEQEIDAMVRFQLEVHIRAGRTTVFDEVQAKHALIFQRERAKALAASQDVATEVPECIEARAVLMAKAKELQLLASPLDALVDALGGPSQVAEMTGRRGRLVRKSRNGHLKYELRPENEETSLNIRERELFMSGKKQVAIISDAASTGVSLHAAVGSGAEGRRRLHITLELPWSADKAIQQLGRSHRSNQSSAPVFRLLVTDLGGERRFAAAVAKRLASLGALTKGDRRAATGADFSSFDLDTKYGRKALRLMLTTVTGKAGLAPGVSPMKLRPYIEGALGSSQPVPSSTPGGAAIDNRDAGEGGLPDAEDGPAVGGALVEEPLALEAVARLKTAIMEAAEQSIDDMAIESNNFSNVTLFLGRLQCLPVRRQNLMFAYLTEALDSVVAEARASGVYDEGVADLRASSVTLKGDPEAVAKDPATGAITTLAQVVLDRGVSWEQALEKRAEAADAGLDRAANKRHDSGASVSTTTSAAGWTAAKTKSTAPKGTGFYRSRHTDITTQKKLVLLAVRKARHHRHMVITRPNTGTLAYELDLHELLEKYERVPDKEQPIVAVQHAWTQVYRSSDGADYRGSRKVTLGLLSGSVLPLWSALEKTATACQAEMSKAEQALKVYRVILDDGRKLVGVRIPTVALPTLRRHLTEALHARTIVVEDGEGGTVEPVSPVNPKTLLCVKTPPTNILSFFGCAPTKRVAPSPQAGSSANSPAGPGAGGGAKRSPMLQSPGWSGSRKRSKGSASGKNKLAATRNASGFFGVAVPAARARGEFGTAPGGDTQGPGNGSPEIIEIDD